MAKGEGVPEVLVDALIDFLRIQSEHAQASGDDKWSEAVHDRNNRTRNALGDHMRAFASHESALSAAREDAARLDWLQAEMLSGESVELRRWTHDGRRTLRGIGSVHTTLLVHEFAARGGEDENIRDAIDAARRADGGR